MKAQQGNAPTSTRTIWKGAISFGLVHVPIGLYTATRDSGIDFDWLDKRSMEPVGYKRINKRTGKEIASSDIVKGVEYEDGHCDPEPGGDQRGLSQNHADHRDRGLCRCR